MRGHFKQADVVRAVKSAKAAGMKVETVEIVTEDGTTIRVLGKRDEAASNPWDQVLEDDQDTEIRPPLRR
jgi:hypothetical protein